MRFLSRAKDGGPKSTVTGYWLIELKKLFSVALLRFDNGSRDEYHTHAFNSLNWIIKGQVTEQLIGDKFTKYEPSWFPILTKRNTFHRVVSKGTTWVFSIRGPWADVWTEYDPHCGKFTNLTHGRKIVPYE